MANLLTGIFDQMFPSIDPLYWWDDFEVHKRYAQWASRRRELLDVVRSDQGEEIFWAFSAPFADGFQAGGGTTTFSPFGVRDASTPSFGIDWEIQFAGSGTGPDVLAYTWGQLRYTNTTDTYEYGELVIQVAPLAKYFQDFAEPEEPSWMVWPAEITYRYLQTDTVHAALMTLISERYPDLAEGTNEWLRHHLVTESQDEHGTKAMTSEDYDRLGASYTARVSALADAIIAGKVVRFPVYPGAVLGRAYAPTLVDTDTDRALNVRLVPSSPEGVALDPAYYLTRYPHMVAGMSTGTSPHENASDFLDHRGVILCRINGTDDGGEAYGLGAGSLRDAIDQVKADVKPFSVIVLNTSSSTDVWRDATAEGATAGSDQSLVTLDYPINITSDASARMFRPTLKARDDTTLEAATSLLDTLMASDPSAAADYSALFSEEGSSPVYTNQDTNKYETRPLKIAVSSSTGLTWTSGKSWTSASVGADWLTTATTGTMPVLKGNWGGDERDTTDESVRLADQDQSFRCLRVSIDDADMGDGMICISNLAFVEGGVQADSGSSSPEPEGGGGVAIVETDRVRVANCVFFYNYANRVLGGNSGQDMYRGAGAGAFCLQSSPLFDGCYFAKGEANSGGGLSAMWGCWPTVRHCVFWDNLAAQGGGMDQLQYPYPSWGTGYTLTDAIIESTLLSDTEKEAWPANGPTKIWGCLFDYNEALDDGGNLYGTVWTHYMAVGCVLRYGAAGTSGDTQFQGGGGNIRLTSSSDLVLSGCEVYKGYVAAVEAQADGGGGIATRNSDLALVAHLDDPETPTQINHNTANEFAGGGLMFTANEPGAHKYDPGLVYDPLLRLINAYENGDNSLPGNARLAVAEATFDGNEANSTTKGKGGALYVYREAWYTSPVQTVDIQMQSGETTLKNNVANTQHDSNDTNDMLILDDHESDYKVDSDLSKDAGGALTADFDYESFS